MRLPFASFALKLATSDAEGARWFKLRHVIADPRRLLGALRTNRATARPAALHDRIVVIGTGFAALAFVKTLSAAGYRDIQIVARDDLFGGKCVNSGCMPTEFVLSRAREPVATRRDDLAAFVAGFRNDVADQFVALGWPIINGQVSGIAGQTVVLDDGREIPFDRLAVAMGSSYSMPTAPPGSAVRVIAIEDFWTLAPGTRIVIDGRENVAALSLAEAARSLGLHATVLLSARSGLADLPSFRYLMRRISAAGSTIHRAARLIRIGQKGVTVEDRGKTFDVECDCLLPIATPMPSLPQVDGQNLTVYDLDFARATWRSRPEIAFLGDSAGYFSASEAESHAKLVVRLWETGEPIDLATIRALPISLDGPEPLCIVGAPATLLRNDWIEIDFRALGWSKVHGLEGKLWYLLDCDTGRIESIHICHDHAKNLIAIARLLIDYPVTDDRWLAIALHPTAAEIFLVLAEHAKRRLKRPRLTEESIETAPKSAIYRLPDVRDLSPSSHLPDWLSPADAVTALLSSDPRRILAVRFATAELARLTGDDSNAAYAITFEGDHCQVQHGQYAVTVDYS